MFELQQAVLANVANQMRRMMDDFESGDTSASAPAVDIHDSGEAITLLVEVPGFDKEDLVLEVENRQLTLRGEKREPALSAGETMVHRERRFGRFERSFALGFGVDREAISAEFAHGLLTVKLPKTEPAKARRITVSAS